MCCNTGVFFFFLFPLRDFESVSLSGAQDVLELTLLSKLPWSLRKPFLAFQELFMGVSHHTQPHLCLSKEVVSVSRQNIQQWIFL